VLDEARTLAKKGIREINLIAQDLAAYGTDWDGKSRFLELLQKITEIDGDFRVRLLYIHPDAFPLELLDMIKANSRILPYFDIPIQHASARLLRPMKRTGDSTIYTDLVSKIRKALPECVIRTTIMLGFPGETEEDFNQVYDFVKANRFNWMGSFVYSREEGTYAYDLTDEKTHEALSKVAAKRQKKLERLQEKITAECLQQFVGKEYDVLIEELIEGEDLAIGRIWAQAPEVDGLTVVMGRGMVPGNVYRCGITKVNGVDLEAVRI
ncbi:MAG: radical SAM protein, partial [Spirochaetales bacterium]|nr:radical SAM protein [Spirochaetales bacterium]